MTKDGCPVAQPRFIKRPFGQDRHALAARPFHLVDLRLYVDALHLRIFEHAGDVDLEVEVADVCDDGLVLHRVEVLAADDVAAAGRGDEDVALRSDVFQSRDLIAFHRGLQRADGIDLRDENAGALALQRLGAAFADIAVAADDGDFAGNHHVRCALDAVQKRLAAAIQVVELGLCAGVVDIDCGQPRAAFSTIW